MLPDRDLSYRYIAQVQSVLNQDNFWRFFIDGERQQDTNQKAKYGYLDWALAEPHGLKMMCDTAKWLFSSENINKVLTIDLIKDIHKSAFPFEDLLLFSWESALSLQGDNRYFGCYSSLEKNFLQSRANIIKNIVKTEKVPWICQQGQLQAQWTIKEIEEYLPKLISNYHNLMLNAQNKNLCFGYIIQMAQDLENIHMFRDGNCRTFITLWLNKELISYGFKPTILLNPNDFDHLPLEGLLKKVEEGQKSFELFINTGYPYDNCINDTTIELNIYQLKNISIISPNHHDNNNMSEYQITNLLIQMSLEQEDQNKLNQFFTNKQKTCKDNVFKDFSLLLNKYLLFDSIDVVECKYGVALAEEFKNFEKIDSRYFKCFCEYKGQEVTDIYPNNLQELFNEFLLTLKQRIEQYGTKYTLSFLHPTLCHLSDSELSFSDLNKIKYPLLQDSLKQTYKSAKLSLIDKAKNLLLETDDAINATINIDFKQEYDKATSNILSEDYYDSYYIRALSQLIDIISYTQPELLGISTEQ